VTFLSRLPAGSSEPSPTAVVDTILEQAEGTSLESLLALSGATSQSLRRLHARLLALPAGDPSGPGLAARIREWERLEGVLRDRVRAHPDHTYEGL
jgi:hypothetical protein